MGMSLSPVLISVSLVRMLVTGLIAALRHDRETTFKSPFEQH